MRPVVQFDQYSPEYARNWLQISRDLRENTPIAWSEAHGGFWIVSRYEDCSRVAKDWQTFSSENDIAGTGRGGKGILIPRNTYQFALSESDPPQCTEIRKLETPFLNYRNVMTWEATARLNTDEAIDKVIESGQIDFIRDLAVPMPARTVMSLAGIPEDSWETFAFTAHGSLVPRDHPDYPHDKVAFVQGLMLDLVRQRRNDPKNDIISALVRGAVMGKPMSDEMAVAVLSAVVFGGFDTTTTTIGNAVLYLSEHPQLKDALKQDRKKLEIAIEEWLRLTPPSHSLGRTVVKEVELHGQVLEPGERIMMLWTAANRDPRVFERPDEFWLERPNAGRHLTFSEGIHRCLGNLFGKMEVRVALEVILARMGDFRIDPNGVRRYESCGGVCGFHALPATFTASQKLEQVA